MVGRTRVEQGDLHDPHGKKIQQEIKHSACRSDNLRYVEKTETSLGNTLRAGEDHSSVPFFVESRL